MCFLSKNIGILIWPSLKFVAKGPVDNIDSDSGLVPNRGQAIIWTDIELNRLNLIQILTKHSL